MTPLEACLNFWEALSNRGELRQLSGLQSYSS